MRIGIVSNARPSYKDNARLAYEIDERGHEAVFIDYTRTVAAITEEGRQLMRADRRGNFEPIKVDTLVARIGRFASAGAMAISMLETNNIPTTASAHSVLLARNKFLSQIAFDSAGVPTPYAIAPTLKVPKNSRDMLKMIESDKSRPLVIKTTTGSLGRGVVLAESRRSALSQLQGFDAKDIPFMVQEFVESPDTTDRHTDIRLFVVDGLITASMKRRSNDEDEFRANLALGATAEEYEPTPREAEIALRAYDVIGAKVAGVDIMSSPRGPLVTEVNGNPGFGIEAITGKNVAAEIIELAIKNAN